MRRGPCLPLSRGDAHAGPAPQSLFPPGAPGGDVREQAVSPLLYFLPFCVLGRRILNRRSAGS